MYRLAKWMQAHPNAMLAILGTAIMAVSSCSVYGFSIFLQPTTIVVLNRFQILPPITRIEFTGEELAFVWWLGNVIGLGIILMAGWRAGVARSIEVERQQRETPFL